jgi:hypothetical protein
VFFVVLQDVPGFIDPLHPLRVATTGISMELFGEVAIGVVDLVRACRGVDPELLVVIKGGVH